MNLTSIVYEIQRKTQDPGSLGDTSDQNLFYFLSEPAPISIHGVCGDIGELEKNITRRKDTTINKLESCQSDNFLLNYFDRNDPTLSVRYNGLPPWFVQVLLDKRLNPCEFYSSDMSFESVPRINTFYHALFQSFFNEWKMLDSSVQIDFINNFKLQILRDVLRMKHIKLGDKVTGHCLDDLKRSMQSNCEISIASLAVLSTVCKANFILLQEQNDSIRSDLIYDIDQNPQNYDVSRPHIIIIKKYALDSFSMLMKSDGNQPFWFMSSDSRLISSLLDLGDVKLSQTIIKQLNKLNVRQLIAILSFLSEGKTAIVRQSPRGSKSEIIEEISNYSFTNIQLARKKCLG